MKVYRFEHIATGQGPYTTLDEDEGGYPELTPCYDLIMYHTSRLSHPTPFTEGIGENLFHGSDYRCGFNTVRQARVWFSEEAEKLLAESYYNFVTYEVEAHHVREGRKQILFDRTKAVQIETKMIGAGQWVGA